MNDGRARRGSRQSARASKQPSVEPAWLTPAREGGRPATSRRRWDRRLLPGEVWGLHTKLTASTPSRHQVDAPNLVQLFPFEINVLSIILPLYTK